MKQGIVTEWSGNYGSAQGEDEQSLQFFRDAGKIVVLRKEAVDVIGVEKDGFSSPALGDVICYLEANSSLISSWVVIKETS